jgi:membrane protein required for colicin V production
MHWLERPANRPFGGFVLREGPIRSGRAPSWRTRCFIRRNGPVRYPQTRSEASRRAWHKSMTWLDVAILVIIALSAMVSLMRGFVKEALSLAAWILAFWVAISFAYPLAALDWLVAQIPSPTARISVAFASLFLLTLLAGALVNYLVSQLVRKSGLSGTDRMLGIIFGIGRGVVLVGILVLLAGLTQLPKETWWKQSLLMEHFQVLALWMKGFLPHDVAQNFVF